MRIVELEGPARVSPLDIAAALSSLLGKPVRAREVPHSGWEDLFRAQGMRNPLPRAQMLDGFNAGWICFEGGEGETRKGQLSLQSVLEGLTARQGRDDVSARVLIGYSTS